VSEALRVFEAQRPRLLRIAYRMLGTWRDAEDVVQEAWLRFSRVELAGVREPEAFLVRTVTRLAIDALRAAKVRRADYVGPWLPEPVVGPAAPAPDEMVALGEELSLAFLLLLERLTPHERAVFLLRQSFDLAFAEIAEVVGKSEAACRQLDRRARLKLKGAPPARPAADDAHGRLLASFLAAARDGDLERLTRLLSADVVAHNDGGGVVTAALRPIGGADKVARMMIGLARRDPGTTLEWRTVNGRPGVLFTLDGRPFAVLALEVEEERIRRVFLLVNPQKLERVASA
jgi:RNA polymerase sigma-70 factor (ECF subfamily)